jgi:hypothetical protein
MEQCSCFHEDNDPTETKTTDMRTNRTFVLRNKIAVAGVLGLVFVASSCSLDHRQKETAPVLGGDDNLSPETTRPPAAGPVLHSSPRAALLEHFLRRTFGDATEPKSRYQDRYRLTLSGNRRYLLVSTLNNGEVLTGPVLSASRVVDLQTLKMSPEIPSSTGAIAISNSGRYVALSLTNTDVIVLDAQNPDRYRDAIFISSASAQGRFGSIDQLTFSRDDQHLLVSHYGHVDVYRISTNNVPIAHSPHIPLKERKDIVTSISLHTDGPPIETIGFGTDDKTIVGAGFDTVNIWAPFSIKPRAIKCRCVSKGMSQPQIEADGRTIRFIQGNNISVWDRQEERATDFIHSHYKVNDTTLIDLPDGLIGEFNYSEERNLTDPSELEIFRPDGTTISQQPIRNDLLGGHSDKPYAIQPALYTSGGLVILAVSQVTLTQSGPPATFRVLELS